MSNIWTKEEQQMYEMLQDLWGRVESVDDVFEEVSGYMNGMRSVQSENATLREALDRLRVWALDNHSVPTDIVADVEYALAKPTERRDDTESRSNP